MHHGQQISCSVQQAPGIKEAADAPNMLLDKNATKYKKVHILHLPRLMIQGHHQSSLFTRKESLKDFQASACCNQVQVIHC
jgi:hypothetical protein